MKSKRIVKVTKAPKNVKLPKYEFGTYVEDPNSEIYQSQIGIAKAKMKAANNPWAKGLSMFGNLAMQYGTSMMSKGAGEGQGVSSGGFNWGNLLQQGVGAAGAYANANNGYATGGKVGVPTPIEAEGDEVMETPNGEVQELNGPSHAEGGIDMVVPSGTEIFSKRVKGPDGKSMADRKIAREKQEQKLEKLLKGNPTDKALKDTYGRTKQNNEKQEKADMMKMQFAKMMSDMAQHFAFGGTVEKFATGGIAGQYPETQEDYSKRMYDEWYNPQPSFVNNFGQPRNRFDTPENNAFLQKQTQGVLDNASLDTGISDSESFDEMSTRMNRPYAGEENKGTPPANKDSWMNKFSNGDLGVTTGDMIGLAGQLYSTFKPMQNTRANRAGDTPNINAFANYGKDALAKMDQSKQYVNQVRDNQLSDLELSRTSAIKRGRNSARGVNTMRALDLATDANANNSKSQIYNQFAQAMQQIYGQEATLHNDKDAHVMQGEQNKDLADRQDRDNYFSQMAEDIATKGTGLQHIGKNVNAIKERNVTSNVMDSLFPDFNMNAYTGKMKKVVTNVASENSEFLKTIPDKEVRDTVIDKVAKREWYIGKDNKVYLKEDNKEININKPK
jgi:hypothetical protein